MPDLQSELSKVIDKWEEPDMPTTTTTPCTPFQTTTNVARASFDVILKNPGITRKEMLARLPAQGYNRASVHSLMGQMKRQGRIKEENGGLYALVPEYVPLQSYLAFKNRIAKEAAKAVVEAPPKRKYERKAQPVEAVESAPKVVAPKEFNAEEHVNSLTLKQAKAVYEELKKVFG